MRMKAATAQERFSSGTMMHRLSSVIVIVLLALFSVLRTYSAQSGTVISWGAEVLPLVDPSTRFIAVGGGNGYSVALKPDGSVVAWGANYEYECVVPTSVTNVRAIAVGEGHTLALNRDGTVVAWGYNDLGQCSVSADLSQVAAVVAGDYHSLALKSDGTVVAWGEFIDVAGGPHTNTVPPGLSGVIAIAAGAGHDLALMADHTVVMWGIGNYGVTNAPSGLSNVVAIAARSDYRSGIEGRRHRRHLGL
jgi:alpha-tubulin suppressor-like RCC1 family protein